MAEDRESRLTALVEAYQETLLKICYVYLKDRDLARDAVQETFFRAYRGLAGFRGESSEKTWLIRIAANVCRSQLRGGWFRCLDRRVTPEDLPVRSGCVPPVPSYSSLPSRAARSLACACRSLLDTVDRAAPTAAAVSCTVIPCQ